MTDTGTKAVDIPEPDEAPPAPAPDPSLFDPGSELPLPPREPELGEDPAYDPGGMGRQPDIAEEDEDYR
jgi:hypothetical protein